VSFDVRSPRDLGSAASGAARSRRDPRVDGVRRLAFLLDAAIPIPGTPWRIGLDPLIGLVPGIGDTLGALASLYAVLVAARLGAPPSVLARMGVNTGLDALVGAVPLVGDLFDVAFRGNLRNVEVLEAWLSRPTEAKRSSRLVVAAVVIAVVAVVAAVVFAVGSLVAWGWRTATT
jgi:uncharacterized protein DUF4112